MRSALVFGLLLLPGFAIRLWAAFLGVETLLLKSLPDDAFYYFTIARNIAGGFGSTFDKIAPTNGYHPLWMGLILPAFVFFKGIDAPVTASLVISSILYTCSAVALRRVMIVLGAGAGVATAAAVLFYYSPTAILFSLNGLETSAAVLALLMVLLLYLQRSWEASRKAVVLLGVTLGVSFLARTDLVLFSGLIVMAVLAHFFQRRRYTNALLLVVSGLAVVTPWLVWNLATFGQLVQVSGKALAYYEHKNWIMEHPGITVWDEDFGRELRARAFQSLVTWGFYSGLPPLPWEKFNAGFKMAPLLLAGFTLLSIVSYFRKRELWNIAARLWPLLLFVPVYFTAHELVRWSGREWYASAAAPLLFISLGLLLEFARRALGRFGYPTVVALAALLTLAYIGTFAYSFRVGTYAHQKGFQEGLVLLKARFKPGTTLGISDCGYTSYVLPDYRIVNLDGLVNNAAYAATRNSELAQYIVDKKIEYSQIRPFLLKDWFMGQGWRGRFENDHGWLKLKSDTKAPDHLLLLTPLRRDADRFFVNGWSLDPARRVNNAWSEGPESTINLPMKKHWGDVCIDLNGIAFKHPDGTTQTVTVTFNGKKRDEPIHLNPNEESFWFYVPKHEIRDGMNVIHLHYGWCVVPSEVDPSSSDDRCIAYLLQGVQVRKPYGPFLE